MGPKLMPDLIQIRNISELKNYKIFIDRLYKNYGKIYFHSFYSMMASFKQNRNLEFYIFIDNVNSIVSAFEKKDKNIWQCYFQGYPYLAKFIKAKELVEYNQEVKELLKARTLYFPLVYDKEFYEIFRNCNKFHIYKRLPSPTVEKPITSSIIWDRVLGRYGKRARKQKNKFENYLHVQRFSGVDVKSKLSSIEFNSWKHKFGQDMLSRGNQIEYYSELIKSSLASITFAVNKDNKPIAYRIDCKINKVIYVLKWSYDDRFKKFSPGFYLLTVDLFKSYPSHTYEYIDLYGSPDKLKSLLETERIERFDAIYSDFKKDVVKIKNERSAFDKKVNANLRGNRGIRKMFELDHT